MANSLRKERKLGDGVARRAWFALEVAAIREETTLPARVDRVGVLAHQKLLLQMANGGGSREGSREQTPTKIAAGQTEWQTQTPFAALAGILPSSRSRGISRPQPESRPPKEPLFQVASFPSQRNQGPAAYCVRPRQASLASQEWQQLSGASSDSELSHHLPA